MRKMFLRFEEAILLYAGPPPKHISPGRERKKIKGKKKPHKSEWSTFKCLWISISSGLVKQLNKSGSPLLEDGRIAFP